MGSGRDEPESTTIEGTAGGAPETDIVGSGRVEFEVDGAGSTVTEIDGTLLTEIEGTD